MSDNPNFSEKALEHIQNNDKKYFLAALTPDSKKNILFILSITLFLIAIMFFVKMPIKIDATGIIKTSSETEHVLVNKDSGVFYVEKINAIVNQKVNNKEALVVLSNLNNLNNKTFVEQSLKKIDELNKDILNFSSKYDEQIEKIEKIIIQQKEMISLSDEKYQENLSIMPHLSKSYVEGTMSKIEYYKKKDEVSDLKIAISNLKKELAEIELNLVNIEREKILKISDLHSKIYVIKKDLIENDEKNSIEIVSPCQDCFVKNIILKEGDIISKKSPILTIGKKNTESKSIASIYIDASKYSSIEVGTQVNLKMDAFPYLKFGTVKSKITYISKAPIEIDGKKVFLAESIIEENNNNIKLNSGMSFSAHIIKSELPLFKFILKQFI